ncbi:MAG TPA: oligosaccharide flippase family protein [Lacipirellulaceae bacterium]|nr:oligosaccharide flippase family protein [Lacipirellulaceae bacterium]
MTSSTDSTSSTRLRPDTLAASVAILLLASVVQRSVGFGRGVLFCRWLTPDELGTWELAYSFLLLAAPVIVLGLPGSFGRYLERFRQRGQLRTFLRRASIWTATLTAVAVGMIVVAAGPFSELIFGRGDERSLVVLLAISLVAVILHHFLEALFAALRKFSIVSAMHFCQSMLFAAMSLGLLWWWRFAAESIVIGYGMACLVSAGGALVWKGRALAEEAAPDDGVAHREFWPPLVRFAVWVWLTNLLCHLFGVVDRYMLVHWSGLDNESALALVGQYHASRIVPLLFLSVADLLAGIVLPYLSHDWEAGERARVSDRLNLVIKLTSLVTMVGGVVVLWAAPLLFHVAFEGRYDEGLAVLPWTLTYCVWYSLLLVAQNYIWCAERVKWSTVPLAAGLAINFGLNIVLIPAWGLHGAVVATTAATGSALGVLYWINRRAGMRLSPGMIWLTIAPAALSGGAWCATTSLVALVILLPFSKTLFTHEERDALVELGRTQLEKLSLRWSGQAKTTEASHAV